MRRAALLLLLAMLVAPAAAGAASTGGAAALRPVAQTFRIAPGTVAEGAPAVVRLRVVEPGVDVVQARIVAVERGSGRIGAAVELGRVRTGATVDVPWPADRVPAAGRWLVRLHVKDPQGAPLLRSTRRPGWTNLQVRPRPRPEKPQTEPPAQPSPPPGARGGIFPVAGPWSLPGTGGMFGAGRAGHGHEGQDIAAAEGTPVVAPVAGTVAFAGDQPSAAGLYVVLEADDGAAMFFAHCQAGSVAVARGARVAAGAPLCRVGMTGSATGPHLHFELWPTGWRDRGGTPVDPLPLLRAWAGLP